MACLLKQDTLYFNFLAAYEKEFYKILSWCKKQFVYQESNCHSTVMSRGYIV